VTPVGVVIGLGGAPALTRWLKSLLFGVGSVGDDPGRFLFDRLWAG
jgi:hypothetical protein